MIRKGMVWRIRNGHSVRIREDKWLPVQAYKLVILPLPTVAPGTKVSSLINSSLEVWNSNMVNQLFRPHEASAICGMPLSNKLPSNRIIWRITSSGMYKIWNFLSKIEELNSIDSENECNTKTDPNTLRLFYIYTRLR